MLDDNSSQTVNITIASIRQKFRKQKRDLCIQRSFQDTRRRLLTSQRYDRQISFFGQSLSQIFIKNDTTLDDASESNILSIVTIRQKFRQQKRNRNIRKSFLETRQKLIVQERKQKQQKWLFAQNKTNNQVGRQLDYGRWLNYQQNLCFNNNFGFANIEKSIQKNCQNFTPLYHPNPHYNQIHPFLNNNNNNNMQIIGKFHNNNLKFPQLFPNTRLQLQQITHYQDDINKQKQPIQIITKRKQQKRILLKYKKYLVYDQIIGTGTYSKVYLGLDIQRNVHVAVKQITDLQENQIKVLMSVESPHIIKLYEFWKSSKSSSITFTYLILDLCQRNLRQQIKRHITFEQKIKYFQHIINGLDTLFAHNIIHRDLKFENILVTKQQTAKIADFGLAKDMGLMSNVASLRCGTPYTMAPQIFFSQGYRKPYYSQKCDIWSLGVILHQIIHSKHPFNYQSQRMMNMDRVGVVKKHGYLDTLIDRALVKDPNLRISWDQFKSIFTNKGIKLTKTIQNNSQTISLNYNFKKKKCYNNLITEAGQKNIEQQTNNQRKCKQLFQRKQKDVEEFDKKNDKKVRNLVNFYDFTKQQQPQLQRQNPTKNVNFEQHEQQQIKIINPPEPSAVNVKQINQLLTKVEDEKLFPLKLKSPVVGAIQDKMIPQPNKLKQKKDDQLLMGAKQKNRKINEKQNLNKQVRSETPCTFYANPTFKCKNLIVFPVQKWPLQLPEIGKNVNNTSHSIPKIFITSLVVMLAIIFILTIL